MCMYIYNLQTGALEKPSFGVVLLLGWGGEGREVKGASIGNCPMSKKIGEWANHQVLPNHSLLPQCASH